MPFFCCCARAAAFLLYTKAGCATRLARTLRLKASTPRASPPRRASRRLRPTRRPHPSTTHPHIPLRVCVQRTALPHTTATARPLRGLSTNTAPNACRQSSVRHVASWAAGACRRTRSGLHTACSMPNSPAVGLFSSAAGQNQLPKAEQPSTISLRHARVRVHNNACTQVLPHRHCRAQRRCRSEGNAQQHASICICRGSGTASLVII